MHLGNQHGKIRAGAWGGHGYRRMRYFFFVKKQERRPTFLREADDMGIGGWVFFYVGKNSDPRNRMYKHA
jgi:hypothetical protein